MGIQEMIYSWLSVLVDFLNLVGLTGIADAIASKIVMPL